MIATVHGQQRHCYLIKSGETVITATQLASTNLVFALIRSGTYDT